MRIEKVQDEIVELGVASEETLGSDLQGIPEGAAYFAVTGISDLD